MNGNGAAHDDMTETENALYNTPNDCKHWSTMISVKFLEQKFGDPSFQSLLANKQLECDKCTNRFPYLWACLDNNCNFVGCGRTQNKHSLEHYLRMKNQPSKHCLCINLDSTVIWCYECDKEIIDDYSPKSGKIQPRDIRKLLKPQSSRQERSNSVTPSTPNGKPLSNGYPSPKSPKRDKNRGLCGLSNLGNTCYMNAALQCISNCEPLTTFFLEYPVGTQTTGTPSKRSKIKLANSYRNLMEQIWSGKFSSVPPQGVVRDIMDVNPFFRGFSQQELLRCVLDRLNEELKQERLPPPKTENNNNDNTNNKTSDEKKPTDNGLAALFKQHPTFSIISNVFEGALLSKVRCLNCNKEFLKADPFYDLSISFPNTYTSKKNNKPNKRSSWLWGGTDDMDTDEKSGTDNPVDAMENLYDDDSPSWWDWGWGWVSSVSNYVGVTRRTVELTDCLNTFCSTELLTGNDKYKCEHCKALHEGLKTLSLLRLPQILCIHLKRFRYDSYFSSKITDHVNFPLKDFDASQFCGQLPPAEDGSKIPELQHMNTKEDSMYDLVGIINHRGGLGGGHYVAYAKNFLDNNWYEFDDSNVTQVTEAQVKNMEAYVLFYKKQLSPQRKEEISKIKALIKERVEVSIYSSYLQKHKEPTFYVNRYWYILWKTATHPGRINNEDYLCYNPKHKTGGDGMEDAHTDAVLIKPEHAKDRKFKALPQSAWDALYATYGGGPAIQKLIPCESCEKEAAALEVRRQFETKAISDRDRTYLLPGESWYLLSSKWTQQWHEFIHGGPNVPGPISNQKDLLDDDGHPKSGLQKARDYRGVNPEVWSFFIQQYGGGPELKRRTISIYDTSELKQPASPETDKQTEQSDGNSSE